VSEGRPDWLNRIIVYDTVQEQSAGWGSLTGSRSLLETVTSSTPVPEVRLTFTDVPFLATGPDRRKLVGGWQVAYNKVNPFAVSHSQLRGVNFLCETFATGVTVALTNNLLERCTSTFAQGYTGYYTFAPFTLHVCNNLFRLGDVVFTYNTNSTW
jgi:hypothetical protein